MYKSHSPLNLLSVEYLDGHLVSGQLVLSQLHLTKAAMTKGLTKNVPKQCWSVSLFRAITLHACTI